MNNLQGMFVLVNVFINEKLSVISSKIYLYCPVQSCSDMSDLRRVIVETVQRGIPVCDEN